MKKDGFIGFCFSLFVFCLMTTASGAQDEATGSPSVVFPEPGIEFDAVFEGVPVEHDFVVKNRGTGTLDIKRASGG